MPLPKLSVSKLAGLLPIHADTVWWRTRFARSALLYLLVLLWCAGAATLPSRNLSGFAKLERFAFDWQMNVLRNYYPRPVDVEPVLIGIDESTMSAFSDAPLSLWHRHLAQTLEALTHAKPAAVGMDIVLPENSYEKLMPGAQLELIRSLVRLKQHTMVSFGRTVTNKKVAPVHPTYLRMLGDESFSFDQALQDPDLVARRFNEKEVIDDPSIRSFAGHIANGLNRKVENGYIDYSRGASVTHIPMQQVTAWLANGDDAELRRHFDGKVVLIGSLLNDLDKWKLPVALRATGEDRQKSDADLEQPGVLVHLQTLRSLLGAGLIKPLPDWAAWLFVLLIATVVWVASSMRMVLVTGVLGPLGLLGLSLLALTANLLLPIALWIGTLIIALLVRAIADGLATAVEKKRLKQAFSGSVSPDVYEEIMRGALTPDASGKAVSVCVLFSDIRGFTALSEKLPPEMVTVVLARYFDRMVAVVLKYHGTLDKFIGDGMMVFFGAPRQLARPCENALLCARDMALVLQELNGEFAREQLPTLAIGIGLNYGNAVVGFIGSTKRHNYSAIGDVVNVASRVEGLTKKLGDQVLLTESVMQQLGNLSDELELVPRGDQEIQGHSAVKVWSLQT
ncbi:hypothetical protein BH11PSE11_BH11PSE11_20160 [soil metagenome]